MTRPGAFCVIATRDKPDDLGRCLAALAAQTLGEQLEVIVVDDGSTADIQAVVRRQLEESLAAVRTAGGNRGGAGA